MERNQAKEILERMSLEDCIKMWNEGMSENRKKISEIHEVEDDEWWNFISQEIGAYYIMWGLYYSESTFNRFDEYFFYENNGATFISFSTKEEMLKLIGEWFMEELINRN